MAACISRGPKSTVASQHTPVTTHTNNCTQQQYNQIVKIYTEWGNHYLEKARFKRLIQNLQTDLTDGVLLADVVEAVCSQKVPDINRKPKSAANMSENIVNCLTLLERIGVTLDGITVKDVKDGNLKTTLGLFFSLSKYKQQQKQKALQTTQGMISNEKQQKRQQHVIVQSEEMKQSRCNMGNVNSAENHKKNYRSLPTSPFLTPYNNRLPSPYYNSHSGSANGNVTVTNIPTLISQRQSRAAAPNLNSLKSSSANSSRSASPSHSFIPTPKSHSSARSSLNEKQLTNIRSFNKLPTTNHIYNSSPVSSRNSVVIKGLNSKDKNKTNFNNFTIESSKRTSSSSGVSSTRSERSSDSSNSLCNDVRSSLNEQKENNALFAVTEIKPILRKKVIVKPNENKIIKLPSRPTSYKVEEKNISEENSLNINREENKTVMNDSVRLSSSGIPKPTAAVKGTAKPTNSVAPMIVKIDNEEKQSTDVKKTENKENEEIAVNLISAEQSKHSSLGDEEDASLLNIKPMEPILRGYKRGIIFPRRISTSVNGNNQKSFINQSISYCYPSRFDVKKTTENEDAEILSGYVSDGDVLQSNGAVGGKYYNEVDNGYMSEGGAHVYDRYANNLEMKLNKTTKKNELPPKTGNLSSISDSSNCQQSVNDRVHSTDVLTALSTGSPFHKLRSKINGRGPGSDEGPISPPEPTPIHAGSYSTFTSSPPHMSPPEPTPVVYRVIGARSHVKKSDNSQQTDHCSVRKQSINSGNAQWKKYTDSELCSNNPRNNTLVNADNALRARNENENARIRDKRSPSVGYNAVTNTGSLLRNKMDKRRTSSNSSSREELNDVEYFNGDRKLRSDNKNKVRGVPSSFGYAKRSTNATGKESRTAQVSAVPRTKVKVSGGTQTDMKSYSLSPSAASQLSQSVRERIMMGSENVPKSPARTQNVHKPVDRDSLPGSLSDSTYSDLQLMNQNNSWFRHGSSYTASLPTRTSTVAGLMDADSIESLPAQLHHRASLTNARLLTGSGSPSSNLASRLSRSNSISYLRERTFPRSTKSEKLYPSMLQRSDELEPLYSIPLSLSNAHGNLNNNNCSQDEPPSPTPSYMSQNTSIGNSSRYHYGTSPSSSSQSYSRNSPYMNFLTKMNSKDEDMHGSSMSLVSTASSSLYSTPEDKQAQEMRRLRKDLSEAQQKVHKLTSQLSTNVSIKNFV